jgi:hypothetical protein
VGLSCCSIWLATHLLCELACAGLRLPAQQLLHSILSLSLAAVGPVISMCTRMTCMAGQSGMNSGMNSGSALPGNG